MNKERKIKILIFVAVIILIAIFWFLNFNLIIKVIVILGLVVLSLMVEIYLRIQHNIDQAILELDKNRSQHVDFISRLDNLFFKIESGMEGLKSQQKNTDQKMTAEMQDLKSQQKKQSSLQLMEIRRAYRFFLKKERENKLLKMAPNIFGHKTVLYIGARPDRYDFLMDFVRAGYEVTVLEAYKPNVDYFEKKEWIKNVIFDDVVKLDLNDRYDVIFWWHGPEHIPAEDLEPTLTKLEKVANKLVILGCPWGQVNSRKKYDNPYEKHRNYFNDGLIFEERGYSVDCIGEKDVLVSNILAIKRQDNG